MACVLSRRVFRLLPLYIIIILFVAGGIFRLSSYNQSLQSMATRTSLSTEAICVREVLEALKLPLSRCDYSLQTLEHPLDLTLLSRPCQAFLIPQKISDKRRKKLECFLPEPWFKTFLPWNKERIQATLLLIRDSFDRANIPIAMEGGTALGSWRMHGQIPYDPDVDFFVLWRYKPRAVEVIKALQKTHPRLLSAAKFEDNIWKIHVKRQDGSNVRRIDVFFLKIRSNDSVIDQPPPTQIQARSLLPFVQRPFEGILFKSWRNMMQYLPQLYGKGAHVVCKPTPWISSYYKIKCGVSIVKCSELNYFFNFARRWEKEDGKLVEVLFNRSHAISVFYSPDGV